MVTGLWTTSNHESQFMQVCSNSDIIWSCWILNFPMQKSIVLPSHHIDKQPLLLMNNLPPPTMDGLLPPSMNGIQWMVSSFPRWLVSSFPWQMVSSLARQTVSSLARWMVSSLARQMVSFLTWCPLLDERPPPSLNQCLSGQTVSFPWQTVSSFPQQTVSSLVFAGSVLWTEKIHRTELNWTVVQSIFQLQLPKFGVILVASCLISKIIQNCLKTGWNRLQLVKRSRVLHSLVATFITFNLIFGSSKTVKNWERYNEIHFGINTFFVQLVPEWL